MYEYGNTENLQSMVDTSLPQDVQPVVDDRIPSGLFLSEDFDPAMVHINFLLKMHTIH